MEEAEREAPGEEQAGEGKGRRQLPKPAGSSSPNHQNRESAGPSQDSSGEPTPGLGAYLHAGLVEVHIMQLLPAARQLHLEPLHAVRLLPQRVQLVPVGASGPRVCRQLDVLGDGQRQGSLAWGRPSGEGRHGHGSEVQRLQDIPVAEGLSLQATAWGDHPLPLRNSHPHSRSQDRLSAVSL